MANPQQLSHDALAFAVAHCIAEIQALTLDATRSSVQQSTERDSAQKGIQMNASSLKASYLKSIATAERGIERATAQLATPLCRDGAAYWERRLASWTRQKAYWLENIARLEA